jgi:hypothetical protein
VLLPLLLLLLLAAVVVMSLHYSPAQDLRTVLLSSSRSRSTWPVSAAVIMALWTCTKWQPAMA